MFYEFYLDLYFVENLMMNYCVLQMTCRVIRCRKPLWKMMLAATCASLVSCVLILLPVRRNVFLSAALSFFFGSAMAVKGCGKGKWRESAQTVTIFWMIVLVMGSIWQFLKLVLGMAFVYAIPAGYAAACMVWRFRGQKRRERHYLCDVKIVHHEREVQLKALLDSGNQLRQPGTGKPVHIVDISVMQKILNEKELHEMECMMRMESPKESTGIFSYIPFHTIGNDHGVMPMLVLEMLHIKHGESEWNTNQIVAAVSKRTVSSLGEYQMILHPEILE